MAPPRIDNPRDDDPAFWKNVDMRGPDECWPYLGYVNPQGYGQVQRRAIRVGPLQAHRYAYEIANGVIVPDSLVVDHLCRNRACCNPGHLDPVTQRDNTLRGVGVTAMYAARTRCKHGHEFDETNTRWYTDPAGFTYRTCRACSRARAHVYYHRYRSAAARKAA